MLKLIAQKREIFGKAVKAAREEGKMPIVVYGGKEEPSSFFVETKEFKKILREAGESGVVVLETKIGNKNTLIHDVGYDPISSEPVHADFLAVDINKTVQVSVPLEFVGESPAIKLGGILVKVMHEIEVEALPNDLPHQIEVDISSLIDNDSQISVADLKTAKGVTIITLAEEVVAAVTEANEEVPEEVAPDLANIEVEKKGKKEETEAAA